MNLPKVLRMTPPGRRALRLIEARVQYLHRGGAIPQPRHGTVDGAATLNLAFMEARAAEISQWTATTEQQLELAELIRGIRSLKADIVDDQSGWLVWMLVSENAAQLRGIDKYPQ